MATLGPMIRSGAMWWNKSLTLSHPGSKNKDEK